MSPNSLSYICGIFFFFTKAKDEHKVEGRTIFNMHLRN